MKGTKNKISSWKQNLKVIEILAYLILFCCKKKKHFQMKLGANY